MQYLLCTIRLTPTSFRESTKVSVAFILAVGNHDVSLGVSTYLFISTHTIGQTSMNSRGRGYTRPRSNVCDKICECRLFRPAKQLSATASLFANASLRAARGFFAWSDHLSFVDYTIGPCGYTTRNPSISACETESFCRVCFRLGATMASQPSDKDNIEIWKIKRVRSRHERLTQSSGIGVPVTRSRTWRMCS
jgi:hypothetical protein